VARSVSELLPRPFAELTVEDIRTIIADVAEEERESLFFERKRRVSSASLAKSCAAFANTYGGLLLVGIGDEDDELLGIDAIAEPQVWVKDVLRGHVLPLPPFRARSLSLEEDRALLLVLVEESSSTPHLITRQGAIYVRNPGSSDPVPIQDQRRLLDLEARGEQALSQAKKRVDEVLAGHSFPGTVYPDTLAVAPTGVSERFEQGLFGRGADLEPLRRALGEHEDHVNDARRAVWAQHSARVERWTRLQVGGARREGIEVWRDGPLVIQQGVAREEHEPEDDGLRREELAARLRRYLNMALSTLLELGAHGDAELVFHQPAGRRIFTPERVLTLRHDVIVRRSTSLDLDEQGRNDLVEEILAEIDRVFGIGPGHP
jgi:hypothetical protein